MIKIEATAHLTSNFAYLLLACLCVLLHPSSSAVVHGWNYFWMVDLPIFVASSVSVAIFYLCAQIHLHPKNWLREMLLLPLLLALGIGLSLNNARAVLEAIFNHQSEFKRTPKYGIERKGQAWQASRYMPIKNLLPFVELAFAVYFATFIFHAVVSRQFLTIPFLLLFQIGFSYVAFNSFAQWLPRWTFGADRDAPDAVPA